MIGPFSQIANIVRKSRYLLLAGTMLSTLALPQWSAASKAASAHPDQGTIILAQNDNNDPRKKGESKGKQGPQQKGGQQGGQPPQRGQQPQGGQPQQGGQPPQRGQQQGQQQQQQQQPQGGQTQQGSQPSQRGRQQQQKQQQGGQQNQGVQTQQGSQQQQGAPTPPGGQQKQGGRPGREGQTPQGGQQQQQGVQTQQGGQQQGVQPPQRGQPKQGLPTQQGQQKQFQQQKQIQQGGQPPRGPVQGQQNFEPPQRQGFGNFGNVEQLRSQRRERVEAGGRRIIEEPGGRTIIRENGRVFIRHDDSERFRGFGAARVERRGAENFTVYTRPDGVEIITVTDADGRLLRRIRRGPDRREVVLIDNRPRGNAGFFLNMAEPVINIPRERYIVDMSEAAPDVLYETLEAPPLEPIDRSYSLDEVRYNVALRDRMRRVDINTITFDTGSSEVTPEQARNLEAIAAAITRVISANPNEVFLIEGHTDAVGQDDDNLSLSDRRAAAVADILSNDYQIPPENLVTQGYGEQFLKVPTDGPSRENRRVTARRITPLLKGASAQ